MTKVCPLCGFRNFTLRNGEVISVNNADDNLEIRCLECKHECSIGQLTERPKVLAIDADGTILGYTGFSVFGKPLPGIVEELNKLISHGWKIAIWTCRNANDGLKDHLVQHAVPFHWINENPFGPKKCSSKIYADVYLDDKGLCFTGFTNGLANSIMSFKPWHSKTK